MKRRRWSHGVLLALALQPGCAWTLAIVTADEHLSDAPGAGLIPAMYGTSVHLGMWARVVRGDGEHLITHVLFPLLWLPVFAIDFPLSLTMDVLLLPVAIPAEVVEGRSEERSGAAGAERRDEDRGRPTDEGQRGPERAGGGRRGSTATDDNR